MPLHAGDERIAPFLDKLSRDRDIEQVPGGPLYNSPAAYPAAAMPMPMSSANPGLNDIWFGLRPQAARQTYGHKDRAVLTFAKHGFGGRQRI